MAKIAYSILTVLLCGFLLGGCGNIEKKADENVSYSMIDYQGTEVSFKEKPHRIITLSMGTDEIALGLVTTDRLLAVNALLDDPINSNITALAKKIPKKITHPSAEEILALKADLVIVPDWKNIEMVDNLREMGLKVIVVPGAKNIAEVKVSIEMIAAALGEQEKGQQLLGLMDEKLGEIKKKVDKIPLEKRKKVVLISLMPAYGGIGSSFDDACTYAGVINGAATAGLETGQAMTKELLVKINPDIMFMPVYNDHGAFDINKYNREYLDDPSLQTISAIKNNALVYPRESYIYNISQDFVLGLQEIARCVYGSEFDFPDNAHLSVSGESNN